MYSVVLMAALTSGTATPDWCHRSCCGCYGGWGGCYGGSYGGYGGCYGGWGCYGGCYGGYGGYGGFGSWGTCMACYGCYAGYGCYGGGWGCYGWGCYSCYAGAAAWSCAGCYGGWSCYGMPYGTVPYTQSVPVVPGTGGTAPEKVGPPAKGGTKEISDRGRLVVELPTDAKLFIDDQPMKTQAARRVFQTPPLQPGQTYYYILRAELTRNGQTARETVRVLIRPGEEAHATFPALAPATTNTVQASR